MKEDNRILLDRGNGNEECFRIYFHDVGYFLYLNVPNFEITALIHHEVLLHRFTAHNHIWLSWYVICWLRLMRLRLITVLCYA